MDDVIIIVIIAVVVYQFDVFPSLEQFPCYDLSVPRDEGAEAGIRNGCYDQN